MCVAEPMPGPSGKADENSQPEPSHAKTSGGGVMLLNKGEIVTYTQWLNLLILYAGGMTWDNSGSWVCEAHPLMPHGMGTPFDCDCGAPGMPPYAPLGDLEAQDEGDKGD